MNDLDPLDLDEQQLVFHSQKLVIDSLKSGEIENIRISQNLAIDKIVSFGLKEGFLKTGLKSFPDPRKNYSVPIEVLLLPQVLQRLNDEHSLLLAPYMLNNASLITELGYNAKVITEGFNDQNIHKRQAPFHGETLKHVLNHVTDQSLVKWFNESWLPHWRKHAPGRTHQYILDGMEIEVPAHLAKKYQGAGCVKDEDENLTYGYKAVWLQEIIDRKGVIVALTIVPIQVHDLEAAKPLVENFPFEKNSILIADRGFIDAKWITHLKQDLKIDVVIPLRKNMDATVTAVAIADNRKLWIPHPTRKKQWIFDVKSKDGSLYWKECAAIKSGVCVRWIKKDGEPYEVLFVTTKENMDGKTILSIYDQRAEIEESHRQLKINQGLEKLPSKKLTHVVFRVLMSVIGFNTMMLFLNSENCKTFEEYSLKTARQKRILEENPDVIIYTKDHFAILKLLKLLPMLMEFEGAVKDKLIKLFRTLELNPAPS